MLKTSITFVKQSNTTPMNNLTPLQEVASRIYAAKIASGVLSKPKFIGRLETQEKEFTYNYEVLVEQCITEAKALLEATKPEPLEWKPLEWEEKQVKSLSKPVLYSNTNEFEIAETNGGKFVISKTEDFEDEKDLRHFQTLDQAKQFAEHIRTR
jgi:hypothetical protein